MTDILEFPSIVKETIQVASSELPKKPSPIGERVIGTLDPSTLTEEQFRTYPELLFHVTAKPFVFNQETDYTHSIVGPYSNTVGNGLYCTDSASDAALYLKERSADSNNQARIMEFRAFEAKVFDLRDAVDLAHNARVPRDLFEKYRLYINKIYKEHSPDAPMDPDLLKVHASVLNMLAFKRFDLLAERTGNQPDKFSPDQEEFDLRTMLSIYANSSIGTEAASCIFTKFMLEQGFDGIVYNEGLDGSPGKDTPSYVFFNAHKVGTFDNWKKPSTST